MNISIIAPYLPSLSSGSTVRTYHLLKGLAKNNEVTLFCDSNTSTEKDITKFKNEVHANTCTFTLPEFTLIDRIRYYTQNKVPYVERLKHSNFYTVINQIQEDTDIIQITELFSYFILEPYLNKLPGKKILDAHNIDYIRLKSEFDTSPFWRRITGLPVYNNLKKYEIDAVKKVDYVLTCSEFDKNVFSQYKNNKEIIVIPNGVDPKLFDTYNGQEQRHKVLFMGSLSYSPNTVGIKWYLDNVHPLIKKELPEYELVITGMNTPKWLQQRASADQNINLKGFVENIQKEIEQAQVCICPILSGSGTRLKILEYMAMKKPVVSTMKGAEGINITNKKNILLADTKDQFAESIFQLFENQQLRIRLGNNAQNFMKEYYSWSTIVKDLERFYKDL